MLRSYLENSPAARRTVAQTPFGGRSYCSLRVLDQSDVFVDLQAFCQEFYVKAGVLTKGSASTMPLRLTITGTGAATRVTGLAVPVEGHGMLGELKQLFSPLAYNRWLRYQDGELAGPGLDQSANQLQARARSALGPGR